MDRWGERRVGTYDGPAIDADDKVVPGFNSYVCVLVAEDLETERAVAITGGGGGAVGVEAGDEAVEGSEHNLGSFRSGQIGIERH